MCLRGGEHPTWRIQFAQTGGVSPEEGVVGSNVSVSREGGKVALWELKRFNFHELVGWTPVRGDLPEVNWGEGRLVIFF